VQLFRENPVCNLRNSEKAPLEKKECRSLGKSKDRGKIPAHREGKRSRELIIKNPLSLGAGWQSQLDREKKKGNKGDRLVRQLKSRKKGENGGGEQEKGKKQSNWKKRVRSAKNEN